MVTAGLSLRRKSAVALFVCLLFGSAAISTTLSFAEALRNPAIPYRDPSSLVEIYENGFFVGEGTHDRFVSSNVLIDLIRRGAVVRDAGYRTEAQVFSGESGLGQCRHQLLSSAALFDVLGVRPFVGRLYDRADQPTARPLPVVLSYACWKTAFSGDAGIVGRVFSAHDGQRVVVGVADSGFAFPMHEAAGIFALASLNELAQGFDAAVGRVQPPKLALAQSVAAAVERADGPADREILSERDAESGQAVTPTASGPQLTLRVFHGDSLDHTSNLLLAIILVCAAVVCGAMALNITVLLLVIGAARDKELGVRAMLGASPAALYALELRRGIGAIGVGCGAGIGVAIGCLRILSAALARAQPGARVLLDLRVAAGLTIGSFALWAGVTYWKVHRSPGLRLLFGAHPPGSPSRWVSSLQRRGVLLQLATSTVLVAALLVSAAAFVRTVRAYAARDGSLLVAMDTSKAPDSTANSQAARAYVDLDRPHGTAIGEHPFAPTLALMRDSVPSLGHAESLPTWLNGVSASFARVAAMSISKGRFFSVEEETGKEAVAVLDSRSAVHLFGRADPLGRAIVVSTGPQRSEFRIIGLTQPLRPDAIANADDGGVELYVPWTTLSRPSRTLILRPDPTSEQTNREAAVVRLDRQLDRDLLVRRASDLVSGRGALQRLLTVFFTIFGLASMFSAAFGVYALVALTISQRRGEIAVRMAVGATEGRTIRWVLKRHIGPVMFGVFGGAALSWVGLQVMDNTWLIPRDGGVTAVAIAALLIGTIAILAAGAPALAASKAVSIRDLNSQ